MNEKAILQHNCVMVRAANLRFSFGVPMVQKILNCGVQEAHRTILYGVDTGAFKRAQFGVRVA